MSSLRSLSVHQLGTGRYIAPLLFSDALPFALGLELFTKTSCQSDPLAPGASLPELEAEDDLTCLQYILDGRGQVISSPVYPLIFHESC